MKNVYLILAVIGAAVPYFFFGRFIADNGLDLPSFISGLFATDPASGFTTDLLITSFAFWLWSFGEAQRKDIGIGKWLTCVVVNLLVGLSAAFPLFLYFREK